MMTLSLYSYEDKLALLLGVEDTVDVEQDDKRTKKTVKGESF